MASILSPRGIGGYNIYIRCCCCRSSSKDSSNKNRKVIKDFGDNLTFTANPVLLDLAGVKVLCYHGKSLDDLVSLRDLSYDNPIGMMKELLNRRHLAPIYGAKTPLAPEKQDHLLIRDVPDIFVTGHVHSWETVSDVRHSRLHWQQTGARYCARFIKKIRI